MKQTEKKKKAAVRQRFSYNLFKTFLQHLLQFVKATSADALALVLRQGNVAAAKQAGRLEFTQNDTIAFGEKLNFVAAFDIHFAAHLFRKDQTAHLVNYSYNSGVLHGKILSWSG